MDEDFEPLVVPEGGPVLEESLARFDRWARFGKIALWSGVAGFLVIGVAAVALAISGGL